MAQQIIPVILCGGSGTRLAPLSSKENPKQFLKLINEYSLLQNTVMRAMNVADVSADKIVTVTLNYFIPKINEQYENINSALCRHIVSEPSARNTAAAVALAAIYVKKNFGEEVVMWILPADHHISDDVALKNSLQQAVIAAENNYLTTFGIKPSRPETGYGYIKSSEVLDFLEHVFLIEKFVEKPNLETAQEYLSDGGYLWNSGMFVFKTGSILKSFEELSSDILEKVSQSISFSKNTINVDSIGYSEVPSSPIDIAIMEKAENVAVVPSNPGWSDIGSWQSLYELKGYEGLIDIINPLGADEKETILQSLDLSNIKAA